MCNVLSKGLNNFEYLDTVAVISMLGEEDKKF